MEIKLTQDKIALIDSEDFLLISQFKWRASKDKTTFYALTHIKQQNGRCTSKSMHRLIMGNPKNLEIDHINNNGLDNRKANLRIVTRVQNMRNSKPYSNGTSLYKGVYWHKRDKKWCSSIKVCGKQKDLGRYQSEIAAANAYNVAAKKIFGEHAKVNII